MKYSYLGCRVYGLIFIMLLQLFYFDPGMPVKQDLNSTPGVAVVFKLTSRGVAVTEYTCTYM